MLSVFPNLFSYSLLIPFIFRLIIGFLFIWFGYTSLTKNRSAKITILSAVKLNAIPFWLFLSVAIEMISGILLVIGLYTQIVAIVVSVFLILALIIKRKNPAILVADQNTLTLLLVISLSLLLLGAGFWAIDLPL